MNDRISSSSRLVSCASIEDAIHLVKASGVCSYMVKTDIKEAFRIVPLCPEDYASSVSNGMVSSVLLNGVFIFVQNL